LDILGEVKFIYQNRRHDTSARFQKLRVFFAY